MPTLERLKAVRGLGFAPTPQKIVFQKDAKWCILLHFGYKICSVKSLNIVWKKHEKMEVRDLAFNLKGGLCFFVSFRNFFSDNTRVRIFIFFCRAKRKIFLQNLTLGYITKTLNQIIFFFLHQNQNIFSATLGIRIFF